MEDVKDLSQGVEAMVDALSNLEVDTEHMDGAPADMEVVVWYRERFRRCIEDGVPDAINCYLTKLLNQKVSDLTRLLILKDSMELQL